MSALKRHDNLIKIIEKELKKRGFHNIRKNVEYGTKGRTIGEIDLYARRNNYIIAFEMKCSYNEKTLITAKDQLDRMVKYYFKPYHRVFKMYVTYKSKNSNEYKMEWIKNDRNRRNENRKKSN